MPDQPDVKPPLLQPLETAIVSATTTRLVIQDFFKKSTGVKLATILANSRAGSSTRPKTRFLGQRTANTSCCASRPTAPSLRNSGAKPKWKGR